MRRLLHPPIPLAAAGGAEEENEEEDRATTSTEAEAAVAAEAAAKAAEKAAAEAEAGAAGGGETTAALLEAATGTLHPSVEKKQTASTSNSSPAATAHQTKKTKNNSSSFSSCSSPSNAPTIPLYSSSSSNSSKSNSSTERCAEKMTSPETVEYDSSCNSSSNSSNSSSSSSGNSSSNSSGNSSSNSSSNCSGNSSGNSSVNSSSNSSGNSSSGKTYDSSNSNSNSSSGERAERSSTSKSSDGPRDDSSSNSSIRREKKDDKSSDHIHFDSSSNNSTSSSSGSSRSSSSNSCSGSNKKDKGDMKAEDSRSSNSNEKKSDDSSSSSGSSSSGTVVACEGCGAAVRPVLSCPTCVKLGIKNSYFCDQECFKKNWKKHKEVHAVMQQLVSAQQGATKDNNATTTTTTTTSTTTAGTTTSIDWSKPFNPRDPSTWEGDPYLPDFLNFRFTGALRPWRVRQLRRRLPSTVTVPDYAYSGVPYSEEAERSRPFKIHVHTEEEIERVRAACALGRAALDYAHGLVRPGITTEEIDERVHEFIVSHDAYPSPLNYCGFPKSCCTSVNEVICHGIPDMRPLEKGDLLNIDITVYYRNMHGDLNETYVVGGETDEDSMRLLQGAYLCLAEAIKRCRPGVMYRHIGQFVNEVADKYKLSVVRSYCGHGIGALFHTRPSIPHYAPNKAPATMQPGHVFTIEPMLNLGKWRDVLWPDNWTACTADGKRSAQFEHTLLVTRDGVDVLTARRKDSPPLDCDTMGHDFP